ncbi:hypothetical protein K474DRAFT_749586 [Panus rudis PR-1116 ss-1]|nr:hypothetical protein K474DRAFT_749586 [Panus rudis PR-1116 ss-1]
MTRRSKASSRSSPEREQSAAVTSQAKGDDASAPPRQINTHLNGCHSHQPTNPQPLTFLGDTLVCFADHLAAYLPFSGSAAISRFTARSLDIQGCFSSRCIIDPVMFAMHRDFAI